MIARTSWTPEMVGQLRALAANGVTMREAAKQLGITYDATSTAAARHSVSFNGNNSWSSERIEKMRELAKAGLRKREAADALGVTFDALQKAAFRFQVKFRGRPDTANRAKQKRFTYQKPVAPSLGDRSDEIARFIAERGVTHCPAAFCAPSPQGAVA